MSLPGQSVLIQQARQGDGRALDQLMRRIRPYVRVIVRAIRGGRLTARLDDSDLIQDALLEAARSFPTFRGGSTAEFIVWLRRVARRTALRVMRRQEGAARDPSLEQTLDNLHEPATPSGQQPSAEAIRQEEADQLAAALATLPDDMQAAVMLRHLDGLAHAEVAECLERSEGAARTLYVRALRRLREALPSEDSRTG
jgi:RNA polymerase sigma-70 factor (ECF subfamily)